MTQYPASDIVRVIGTPGDPGRITFADTGGDTLTIQAAVGTGTYSVAFPNAAGAAGEILQLSSPTQLSWVTPAAGSNTDFWFLADEKSTGTDGGPSAFNTWITRDLNTIVPPVGGNTDVQLNVAPAGPNQILVQPGEYAFEAVIPFYGVDVVAARLRDVTNNTTLINGMSAYAHAGGSNSWGTMAVILGDIVIASPTVLEVQYNQTNNGNISLTAQGVATGFLAKPEVYTNVRIFNVA